MIALRRILDSITFLISILPVLWAFGLILFAIRVRSYLGYWPAPNHPDPQFVPFDTHYSILGIGVYANFVALGLAIAFRKVLKRALSFQAMRISRSVFLCGWFLILSMMFLPRINFVTWFMD